LQRCKARASLTELADLPTPEHLDGRSFANVVADPAATTNDHAMSYWRQGISIRTDRYHLTIGHDKTQLNDHQVDPGERTNIAAYHPELVKTLTARINDRNADRKAR
jgi:arylsulfatase A-like enzyme